MVLGMEATRSAVGRQARQEAQLPPSYSSTVSSKLLPTWRAKGEVRFDMPQPLVELLQRQQDVGIEVTQKLLAHGAESALDLPPALGLIGRA